MLIVFTVITDVFDIKLSIFNFDFGKFPEKFNFLFFDLIIKRTK